MLKPQNVWLTSGSQVSQSVRACVRTYVHKWSLSRQLEVMWCDGQLEAAAAAAAAAVVKLSEENHILSSETLLT